MLASCAHAIDAIKPFADNGKGAYTIEYSVQSTGALCDGTTSDVTVINALIDTVNAAGGGTITIPKNVVCGVGVGGLTLKSNVSFSGGGKLKAVAGITNWILGSSSAVSNVVIDDIQFDLDQVAAVPAFSLATASTGIVIRDSLVTWDGDDDTSANFTSAFSLVVVNCAASKPSQEGTQALACKFTNNRIQGTNVDAAEDTCLTWTSLNAGSLDATATIEGNTIEACGGYGISFPTNGTVVNVVGNDISQTLDDAINVTNSLAQSIIASNTVSCAFGADCVATMNMAATNNTLFSADVVPVLSDSGPSMTFTGSGGGLFIFGGYYADGLFFDSSANSAPDHVFVKDIVTNTGGTRSGIKIENPSDFLVSGYQDVTAAGASTYVGIEMIATTTATAKNVVIEGNVLRGAHNGSGNTTCVKVDATAGGFLNVMLNNNLCGAAANVTTGYALTGTGGTNSDFSILDNQFLGGMNALSGFDTAALIATTTIANNRGLQPEDREAVVKTLTNRTASLAQYSVVEPDSGANDAIKQAAISTINPIGCLVGPDATSSGTAVYVAIGGVATCLIDGSGTTVTRGDPVKMSSTAGKLVKAVPGDRYFGYAMETVSSNSSGRVLISPLGSPGASAQSSLQFYGPSACGNANNFMGPWLPNVACNSTESAVYWTTPQAITVTGLSCLQATDATCDHRVTLRVNGVNDATFVCQSNNGVQGSDNSGTVSIPAAATVSLQVTTATGCTTTVAAQAILTYTTN